ncbi:MAG: beta-ketoacyl-ACP synthase [Spirulinaceae cyanobacterium SM2_1_0]|nr:beta-ketoacyl-ACP synthase [Spirulinaceae cyanobacterium SM2_1_0]
MEITITGIGLQTALGDRDTTWQRLLNGESGLAHRQPFAELPPYPLGYLASQPTALAAVTEATVMAALADAQLTPPLPDCGVVIGSSRGCQSEWERQCRQGAWQGGNFAALLPQQAAVRAAQILGTTAPVLAPMAACATGLWCLARALELLRTGRCQQVLAGAVEAPITPLTLAGFAKMGALAREGCYPFDRDRHGFALAEAGAVFVLETVVSAQQRQARSYGQLLGFGLTADGYHVSAPVIGGRSGLLAVEQCLDRSALVPTDIDYIHAHGTGTRLNDHNEAELIRHLFPAGVAVSSTKGATGHTLGASGALGLAFCLLALRDRQLPPNVGLREPDYPDLNLVTTARSHPLCHALCFSFGFGGQNAVLACRAEPN